MRFRVTVDGVQREVEVEAVDAAASAVLAAVVAGVSEADATPEEAPAAYEVLGGVSDAGVQGGDVAQSGAAAGGTRFGVAATLDGRVVQVRVKAGDRVRRSDPLVLIESLKVESWVQAPGAGVVVSVSAAVDAAVSVGEVVLELAVDA